MSGRIILQVSFITFLIFGSAVAAQDSMVVSGGDLRISDSGSGLKFPDGTIQSTASTPGASSVIGNSVQVNSVSMGAGETVNVATLNMDLVGNRMILVLPTISGLTWGAAPAEYGGHNHSLHVDVQWKIIAGGFDIASFHLTAEQNIIQLQGAGFPTPAGSGTVILQATNNSYWSLDDPPYGTSPVASNNFQVVLSAMEL